MPKKRGGRPRVLEAGRTGEGGKEKGNSRLRGKGREGGNEGAVIPRLLIIFEEKRGNGWR